MAYEKTNWEVSTFQKGDATFVNNLNHIEEGIEEAGESGTEVIANPELEGTEDSLKSIQVDSTKYKVSVVSANPTLTGTEEELNSVKIDETSYKISNSRNFPESWTTDVTSFEQLLKKVGDDTTAVVGHTYQGGVKDFTDFPDGSGLGNAEAEIEIISSTLSTKEKIIFLNLYSASIAPYHWSRIYWYNTGTKTGTLHPWQIEARALDLYTTPVYTGTCVNSGEDAGKITLSGTLEKGVYIISMYDETGKVSRTYYFAYSGNTDYKAYSCDCMGSCILAESGTLWYTVNGTKVGPGWEGTPKVELYKMR